MKSGNAGSYCGIGHGWRRVREGCCRYLRFFWFPVARGEVLGRAFRSFRLAQCGAIRTCRGQELQRVSKKGFIHCRVGGRLCRRACVQRLLRRPHRQYSVAKSASLPPPRIVGTGPRLPSSLPVFPDSGRACNRLPQNYSAAWSLARRLNFSLQRLKSCIQVP